MAIISSTNTAVVKFHNCSTIANLNARTCLHCQIIALKSTIRFKFDMFPVQMGSAKHGELARNGVTANKRFPKIT